MSLEKISGKAIEPLPEIATAEELMDLKSRKVEMKVPGNFREHYDEYTNVTVTWIEVSKGRYRIYCTRPYGND